MKISNKLLLGTLTGIVLFLVYYLVKTAWIFFTPENTLIKKEVGHYLPSVLLFHCKILLSLVCVGGMLGLASSFVLSLLTYRTKGIPASGEGRPLFLIQENERISLLTLQYLVAICSLVLLLCMRNIIFQPFLFINNGNTLKEKIANQFINFCTDYIPLHLIDTILIVTGIATICLLVLKWRIHFSPSIFSSLSRGRKVMLLFSVLCLCGTTLFFVLHRQIFPCKQHGKKLNVLFIAVDSLRIDHISAYGYQRAITPNIDSLARAGLNFTNIYTPLARTVSSWVSLLTAAYPHTHGIRHMFPSKYKAHLSLMTLPAILNNNGYHTAVISDIEGDIFSFIDTGFQVKKVPSTYNMEDILSSRIIAPYRLLFVFFNNVIGHKIFPVLSFLPNNKNPQTLAESAKAYIEEMAPRGNFFLTVFFGASHLPFAVPYPWYKRYTLFGYRGKNRFQYHVPTSFANFKAVYEVPNEREIKQITGLYDGAISCVDNAIGDIVQFLKKNNLLQNTLIILSADHGESFFEKGVAAWHGEWLNDCGYTNRVPLIIYDPRRAGKPRTYHFLGSTIDIMPSILEAIGASLPDGYVPPDGRSFWSLIDNNTETFRDCIFEETGLWLWSERIAQQIGKKMLTYPFFTEILTTEENGQRYITLKPDFEDRVIRAKHCAVVTQRWKLVVIPTRSEPIFSLYDRKQDPCCTHNIIHNMPLVAQRLKEKLNKWMF